MKADVTVGSGVRFLGALGRHFDPSPLNAPIMVNEGYPPAISDPIVNAVGFEITDRCSLARTSPHYTELLFGLQGSGPSGGGLTGEDITYSIDGKQYVLHLHNVWLLCGTATTTGPCSTYASPGPRNPLATD